MNRTFSFIFKTYISILLIFGVFLFLFNSRSIPAYLGTSLLGLVDFYLIYLTFRKEQVIDYRRIIIGMLLRIFCISLIILFLSICDIINKLNIIGVLLGIIVYPAALFIGGFILLRWKR